MKFEINLYRHNSMLNFIRVSFFFFLFTVRVRVRVRVSYRVRVRIQRLLSYDRMAL